MYISSYDTIRITKSHVQKFVRDKNPCRIVTRWGAYVTDNDSSIVAKETTGDQGGWKIFCLKFEMVFFLGGVSFSLSDV